MKKAKSRAQRRRAVRNVLLAVSMMMMLMIVTVGGTVAWLTASTDTVENVFTTSDINITLLENKLEYGEDGKPKLDTTNWVEGNANYKMVPGLVLPKNPTVTVLSGSEPCYVFVKVEEVAASIPGAEGAEPTSKAFTNYISYEMNLGENAWKEVVGVSGVYYYKQPATTADTVLPALIKNDQIKVNTTVTKADMEDLKKDGASEPKLKFTAYAIQSENLEVTAMSDIWALAQQ